MLGPRVPPPLRAAATDDGFLGFLFGEPLDYRAIRVEREGEMLLRELREAWAPGQVPFRVNACAFNKTNFARVVHERGCRVLHISCHGREDHLGMESVEGRMWWADAAYFLSILGQSSQIRLAVLSACSSLSMGDVFVRAGVPHVIATTSNVEDIRCINFTQELYFHLLRGKTVQHAFTIARASTEAHHLVLLPSQASHDELIFAEPGSVCPAQDGGHSAVVRLDPPLPRFDCPLPPNPYLKRFSHEIRIAAELATLTLRDVRFVSVWGPRGVGKSATVLAVTQYLHRRLHFPRGVLFRRMCDVVDNLGHAEALTDLTCALDRLLTEAGCARLGGGTGGAAAFARLGEGVSRARSQSGGGQALGLPGEEGGPTAGTGGGGGTGHKYADMHCMETTGLHDVMLLVLDGCDTQDSVKIGVLQQAMTYILETYNVTVLCTSELPLITHGVKSEEVKPLTRVEAADLFCKASPRRISQTMISKFVGGKLAPTAKSNELIQAFSELDLFRELNGNARAVVLAAQRVEDPTDVAEKVLANILWDAKFSPYDPPRPAGDAPAAASAGTTVAGVSATPTELDATLDETILQSFRARALWERIDRDHPSASDVCMAFGALFQEVYAFAAAKRPLTLRDLDLVRTAASDFEGPEGTLDVSAFRDLWEAWLEPLMNTLDRVHLAWAVTTPCTIIHMCSRRDAERMLTRDGEFLLRLSQQVPGALTLSLRGGPDLFIHTTLAVEGGGFVVQVEDEVVHRRYNDLRSLVTDFGEVLQFVYPVTPVHAVPYFTSRFDAGDWTDGPHAAPRAPARSHSHSGHEHRHHHSTREHGGAHGHHHSHSVHLHGGGHRHWHPSVGDCGGVVGVGGTAAASASDTWGAIGGSGGGGGSGSASDGGAGGGAAAGGGDGRGYHGAAPVPSVAAGTSGAVWAASMGLVGAVGRAVTAPVVLGGSGLGTVPARRPDPAHYAHASALHEEEQHNTP